MIVSIKKSISLFSFREFSENFRFIDIVIKPIIVFFSCLDDLQFLFHQEKRRKHQEEYLDAVYNNFDGQRSSDSDLESESGQSDNQDSESLDSESIQSTEDENSANSVVESENDLERNREEVREEVPFKQTETTVFDDENITVKCQRLKFKRLKRFCLQGKNTQ